MAKSNVTQLCTSSRYAPPKTCPRVTYTTPCEVTSPFEGGKRSARSCGTMDRTNTSSVFFHEPSLDEKADTKSFVIQSPPSNAATPSSAPRVPRHRSDGVASTYLTVRYRHPSLDVRCHCFPRLCSCRRRAISSRQIAEAHASCLRQAYPRHSRCFHGHLCWRHRAAPVPRTRGSESRAGRVRHPNLRV